MCNDTTVATPARVFLPNGSHAYAFAMLNISWDSLYVMRRAEPVRLVDMPGDGANEELKLILNDSTERLQEVSHENSFP